MKILHNFSPSCAKIYFTRWKHRFPKIINLIRNIRKITFYREIWMKKTIRLEIVDNFRFIFNIVKFSPRWEKIRIRITSNRIYSQVLINQSKNTTRGSNFRAIKISSSLQLLIQNSFAISIDRTISLRWQKKFTMSDHLF